MIVRALLAALCLLVSLLCLAVFEAASRTALALDLFATAQTSDDAIVRDKILAHALAQLETSWASPLDWHAGAAEAASALYAQRALVGSDPAFLARSAEYGRHAVAHAPVQPHTWARLAWLAEAGAPDAACEVKTCLARSWRSARMTDPETACARLRLAHRAGETFGPRDERLIWFARSGAGVRQIASCLSFLPPETVFPLLLDAQR